jgi:hypothetical protein
MGLAVELTDEDGNDGVGSDDDGTTREYVERRHPGGAKRSL